MSKLTQYYTGSRDSIPAYKHLPDRAPDKGETVYKPHHAGNTPEARLNSRLKNSGTGTAGGGHMSDTITHSAQHGSGPTRVYHNIHGHSTVTAHGPQAPKGKNIRGESR